MSNEELRRAFDALWTGSESRSWVKGRLGKKEADGTIVIKSGRPGFVFVRLGAEGDQGTAVARNIGVPLKNYLPVRMRVDPTLGYYVIYSIDYGARYDAYSGGSDKSYNVGPHTHMMGSGLEYPIEALRFDPGRPQCTSALTVSIEQFRYYFNGSWDTWQNSGTIDLTAYKPASAKWCWVLVGVNPATNTLVAAKGADYDTQAELTDDLIDSIAFVELIPCGAVQVSNADTSLTDIGRWLDARGWINQPVADLDGVPGVTIASETENDSFWYDGSGWVNGRGHRLNMAATATLTVSSGAIDISTVKTSGLIDVLGESGLDDDLDTITGGNYGDIIVLWTQYPGVYGYITLTSGGNINIPATASGRFDNQYEIAVLVYMQSGWNLVGEFDHDALSGLADDDHSQYLLLTGRTGGQVAQGGINASDNLELESTSHATKGYMLLQKSGGNVGIGEATPSDLLHLYGTAPIIRFEDSAASSVYAYISANGINGNLSYDVGIGGVKGQHIFKQDGTTVGGINITKQFYVYDDNAVQHLLGLYTGKSGLVVRPATNPASGAAIFTVVSTAGTDRLRVEHDGAVYVGNQLEVTGYSGLGTQDPEVQAHIVGANSQFGIFDLEDVIGVEQAIMSGFVIVTRGDLVITAGSSYNTVALSLAVPGASYNSQSGNVGGNTVEFRLYSTGELKAIRTAGATAIDVTGWINGV